MSTPAVHKDPVLRIAKRDGLPHWKGWLIRVAAVVLALILSGAFIYAITRLNPVQVYEAMFEGAFGSSRRSWVTIRDAMMLLCIGIGLAPAFKMKFWNIGAEGQILVGGCMTAGLMLALGGTVPTPVLLVIMAIASLCAGAVWGMIPAVFKARWGTNETLFTLMMNYVAIQITSYCVALWENPYGSNVVGVINQSTKDGWFPELFGQAYGLNVLIVAVLTVGMYIYLKSSKQGYEIAVVGESQNTARYAGMNVGHVMMRTMFLSGAISGLVGFIVASGANNTLYDGVANGVGFTSITVAWLSQLNAFAMIVISALLAILEKGAETLQTAMQVPTSISDIVTGILLFCMLGCEFFINYRMIFRRKQAEAPAAPAAAESDQTESKEDASC